MSITLFHQAGKRGYLRQLRKRTHEAGSKLVCVDVASVRGLTVTPLSAASGADLTRRPRKTSALLFE